LNLRGETPTDFKSVALTARPNRHLRVTGETPSITRAVSRIDPRMLVKKAPKIQFASDRHINFRSRMKVGDKFPKGMESNMAPIVTAKKIKNNVGCRI
jgi:hypothetical protein